MINFNSAITRIKKGVAKATQHCAEKVRNAESKYVSKPDIPECPKLKPLEQDTLDLLASAKAIANPVDYIMASDQLMLYTIPVNPHWEKGIINNSLSPEYIERMKFLKSLKPEKLVEYEKVIDEVLEKLNLNAKDIVSKTKANNGKLPDNCYFEMCGVKNLLDLYHENPEIYRYVMNSDFWFKMFQSGRGVAGGTPKGCFKNLSIQSLKELEAIKVKPKDGDILTYYIANSNKIYRNEMCQQQLHNVISEKVLGSEITATRGDKSVACFAEIDVSSDLQKRLKAFNRMFKFKTKKANSYVYKSDYMFAADKGKNLYDYIENAEHITLADAMEMCRFVDKKTQKMILSELNNVSFVDSRFKSYSLADDFVENWLRKDSIMNHDNAAIVQKTKINKGTEAIYIDDLPYPNGQYEVLVNNNPKRTTVTGVNYDKKKNVFYLDTTLEQIK